MPLVLTSATPTAGLGSSAVDRVLQGTPATVSNSWYQDGVIADPGTVTVTIERADGTSVVVGQAASGAGAAARSFTLVALQTALLDRLMVTWTTSSLGSLVTYIEVVGGYLFSTATLDSLLQNPTQYTAAQKFAVRTRVENDIEKAIGWTYVPRYAYETLNAPTYGNLYLTQQPVRALRSVETRSGTTWTTVATTAYDYSYNALTGYSWPYGYRNIRVGYEYGEDYPPRDVSDAAALWAKTRLVQGPIDDRELQRFISDTGAVVSLSTPGRGGSWSGIPDVDAVIEANRAPLIA